MSKIQWFLLTLQNEDYPSLNSDLATDIYICKSGFSY
jgi:hypothetical protein